jgi:hypothetical protein
MYDDEETKEDEITEVDTQPKESSTGDACSNTSSEWDDEEEGG